MDRQLGKEAGRKQEAKKLLRMADKQTNSQKWRSNQRNGDECTKLEGRESVRERKPEKQTHFSLQEKTVWLILVHHLHSCSTQAIFTFIWLVWVGSGFLMAPGWHWTSTLISLNHSLVDKWHNSIYRTSLTPPANNRWIAQIQLQSNNDFKMAEVIKGAHWLSSCIYAHWHLQKD